MSRVLSFVVFLLIASSVVFGVHYYLWARLVRDTGLVAPLRQLSTLALVVLAVVLPLGMAVGRLWQHPAAKPFLWVAYTWMGVMFILFVLVLGADLVRLAVGGVALAKGTALDADKRLTLMRLLGGSVAVAALGSTIVGVRSARRTPSVKDVKVPLSRLPKTLQGSTIVQLSDVHVGPTIDGEWLGDVVDRVNALSPDVVVITGDLVDGSVEELREGVAPLARLQAKYGVYFVTGNHEYYSGADQWIAELTRLGVRVLRNERVRIGEGEASYDLAGIDDASAHQFGNGHGADLPKALAGWDPTRELVLLAHQPKAVLEAAVKKVGLVLSGHTHGGQIWPWGYLVRLTQPYLRGLSKHDGTYIYVSCGTGYWGPPLRLGAPPEITRLELQAPV